MANKEFFDIPKKYKTWSLALLGVGILSVLIGFFMYGTGDVHHKTRFWGTLMHNSIYFLLIVNAAAFFIAVTSLAWGGFQISFRRVAEAVSACVPIVGGITVIVLGAIILGGHHMTHIYHWTDHEAVANDKILAGKSGFLNESFFLIWTVLTVLLWSVLGHKLRKLSRETDNHPLESAEAARKYIFKNTVWAALFLVWFALTVMSVTPWFWLMSIDPHWFSTMYSWYTFASSWVAGIALVTLFIVYLKNNGYLEYTNREHLHDMGKFMFAFSIFWTYLWFSQYMLIWYANIPEETIYFKSRIKDGPYSGIYFLSFTLNFLAPLLLLMKRGAKRSYGTITIMAVVIIFGHWLDFYQMIFGSIAAEHVELNLFDFGVAAGFVGLIMLVTGRVLAKYPLVPKNHPFMKESIIHHT